ncbi:MAG: hypothetical protein ACK5QH_18555, partial [Rubrivivax sp.]
MSPSTTVAATPMHLTLAVVRLMTHNSMLRIFVRFMSVSAVAACFTVAAQPTTTMASGDGWLVSPIEASPTAANPSASQFRGGSVNLNTALGAPSSKAAAQTAAIAPPQAAEAPNVTNSQRSPAAPNTEFQRFILEGTGKQLPLFGYELFEAPAFPSLTNVPVPTDYVVGPG